MSPLSQLLRSLKYVAFSLYFTWTSFLFADSLPKSDAFVPDSHETFSRLSQARLTLQIIDSLEGFLEPFQGYLAPQDREVLQDSTWSALSLMAVTDRLLTPLDPEDPYIKSVREFMTVIEQRSAELGLPAYGNFEAFKMGSLSPARHAKILLAKNELLRTLHKEAVQALDDLFIQMRRGDRAVTHALLAQPLAELAILLFSYVIIAQYALGENTFWQSYTDLSQLFGEESWAAPQDMEKLMQALFDQPTFDLVQNNKMRQQLEAIINKSTEVFTIEEVQKALAKELDRPAILDISAPEFHYYIRTFCRPRIYVFSALDKKQLNDLLYPLYHFSEGLAAFLLNGQDLTTSGILDTLYSIPVDRDLEIFSDMII